jgi:hypothetical protein
LVRRIDMKGALAIVVSTVLLSGCGEATTSGSPAAPKSFAMLSGQRLAGTGSDWIAIASPFNQPANVDRTITPPIQTNDTTYTVAFFDFNSASDAASFYMNPPLDARLILTGILAYQTLAGDTAVPAPSRGLDLRSCLWKGGPGQGGAGAGTPSGGTMDAAGNCSVGTSSSIGVATILQRGDIVVLVESTNNTVIGASASPADLMGNATYAIKAVDLLQRDGLA